MHQGTLIDELIQTVERAEEHALDLQFAELEGQPTLYEMARPEPLIGVA
jgi:hypothetical protein